MAIGVSLLASGADETDTTSYTTASISPVAGRVWLVFVWTPSNTTNADPPDASISGAGITWTSLSSAVFTNDSGATRRKLQIFKGVAASPSSGVLTISYGATAGGCARAILELTGADTTNPIVSGSIVTNNSNTAATSGTVTLNAAANGNNRPIAAFVHNANEGTTPRTNWTEIVDATVSHANPTCGNELQWRSDTFETTASATWTTSGKWGVLAAEIATPASSTPQTCSATQAQTATAPRCPAKVLVA